MNRGQIIKILGVMLIAAVLMLGFEILFSFEVITNWIGGLVTESTGWLVYVVIWILMFVQVCIIPIPAYIVLNACVIIPTISLTLTSVSGWLLIAVILFAYITGAALAYWIGRGLGSKAVKWCAGSEEEYHKWSDTLSNKGKWWYALTIVLPIFPDDLLCFIAGSVKFKFNFFFWVNLIGRGIGLITMVFFLELFQSFNSGGIPWTVVGWGVVCIALLIAWIVLKVQDRKAKTLKK